MLALSDMGSLIDSAKAIVGLRPSFSAHVRCCERGGTRPTPSAFHSPEAFMRAECYDPSVSESFHLRQWRKLSDPTKGFPANYSECDYRRCCGGCIVVKP
jgi:hypothetical protein